MSAIVLLLLAIYGSARLTLWLRGQYLLLHEQKQFPSVPTRPALPQHLPTSLALLLECCYSERVKLIESIRAIARVLITDPDVPLGCVRDFRYRVAVFNAWAAASRWIRTVESLDEVDRHRLAALGFDPQTFVRTSENLGVTVRETSRARALEPFDVDGVRLTRATLDVLVRELERVESRLSAFFGEHPYRA